MAPSGKFSFLLPVGKAGRSATSTSFVKVLHDFDRTYLTVLTGCGQFTPVMRPIDKSPKVRDFGKQIY
ncbi:MAG: hypothetical protein WAT22_10075 [Saprospiraceae bacterium]|nr:hypothetical protein [Saprospiraceae bacterium]